MHCSGRGEKSGYKLILIHAGVSPCRGCLLSSDFLMVSYGYLFLFHKVLK